MSEYTEVEQFFRSPTLPEDAERDKGALFVLHAINAIIP
jgi:hypothetical protein